MRAHAYDPVEREPDLVPILLYHSVSASAAKPYRRYAVAPSAFGAQMDILGELGMTPITVSEYAAGRAGLARLPPRPVVLSFDDGLADFHAEAVPILGSRGFTATLYVTTDYVGGTSLWLERAGEGGRPMLSWSQVREVAAAGIECGAHGCSHRALDLLPAAEAAREIVRSKAMLEDALEREVTTFSYPHGYFDAAVRELVRRAGYASACAVEPVASGPGHDLFTLPRIPVPPTVDLRRFAAIVATPAHRRARSRERLRRRAWRAIRRARAGRGAGSDRGARALFGARSG